MTPLDCAGSALLAVLLDQNSVRYSALLAVPELADYEVTDLSLVLVAAQQMERAGLVSIDADQGDYTITLTDQGASFLEAGDEFTLEDETGADDPIVVNG